MIDIETSRKRAQAALERAGKATPGPWEEWHHGHMRDGCMCLSCDVVVGFTLRHMVDCEDVKTDEATVSRCEDPLFSWADAHFTVEARSDVPQLANDLLQALEEIERLRNQPKGLDES